MLVVLVVATILSRRIYLGCCKNPWSERRPSRRAYPRTFTFPETPNSLGSLDKITKLCLFLHHNCFPNPSRKTLQKDPSDEVIWVTNSTRIIP
jgi:hypothetical protein